MIRTGPRCESLRRRKEHTMRVNELMSSPPISVNPGRPLKEVAEVMLHHRVSAVPVVDASGEIVGILSEADLLTIQAPRPAALRLSAREAKVASDVMTKAVIVTRPETTVDDLVRLMIDHHVKRVPVVANGRLVGMIEPDRRDQRPRASGRRHRARGVGGIACRRSPPRPDRVRGLARDRGVLGCLRPRASSSPPEGRRWDPRSHRGRYHA